MKFIVSTLCFLVVFSSIAFSQSKKNTTDTLMVDGVCGMCKKRIENAVLYEKGVQSASWDVATKILTVTWRTDKTTKQTIAEKIADVGHDNALQKARDEDYAKVHKCCRYRTDVTH